MSPTKPLTAEQSRYAERGLALVRIVARAFSRAWRSVPESDFLSAGHEEVVRAAALFDPTVGIPFEQYARRAINGAMHDLVRDAQRRVLTRVVSPDVWRDEVCIDDLLAEPAGQSATPRAEVVQDVQGRAAELVAATLSAGTLALTSGEDAVIDDLERKNVLQQLRGAIASLEEEERAFVRSYYEEGETVDVIAKRLGVVRRTVFRMQERVMAKLLAALRRAPRG